MSEGERTVSRGRMCAFCGKPGGCGFPAFLIARFGGTRGSPKHAHSPCFKKAKDVFNKANPGAEDRMPRHQVPS